MTPRILLGAFLCLAACSAPQGKRIGYNSNTATPLEPGVAPVATGPGGAGAAPVAPMPTTTTSPVITMADRDGVVGLHTAKTLTVKLPALQRDGYEWRLSEIPDSTVLKLVSNEYTPGEGPAKAGEQTLVFEGVGPGDVNVKMWYGTLWASPMESRTYKFIASVTPEPEKKAKAKKPKKSKPKASTIRA